MVRCDGVVKGETGTLSELNKADAVLLEKMRSSDLHAFEELYYRWNKQVYGFMFKTTRSVSDSEKITQEVFVRLWNMRESIDPRKKIQALIFTIARRLVVDMYRRKGRLGVIVSEEPQGGTQRERSPQDTLEEQEMNLLLEIAIARMPDEQREVCTRYYRERLSPMEIALRLELTYDDVREQIDNGKQMLREMMIV